MNTALSNGDRRALDVLGERLKTILPPEYQDDYEALEPVPMRSADLKYRTDGNVAWDQIWGSFCDLAMAGGPPHKGALLEQGRGADVEAQPDRYEEVAEEICRGVRMAADLDAEPSPVPGWVRVLCPKGAMSAWLVRAIVMENVAARPHGATVDVPAAPQFRLNKEIKNVVTVIAKTSHYWLEHMSRDQQQAIAEMFAAMAAESPLVEPALSSGDAAESDAHERVRTDVAAAIERETGLRASSRRYYGWLGLECPSVRAAIWMMRALVVSNVLARREETILFVPINPVSDPDGSRVVSAMTAIHRLARAKGVL
jgi:sirohydrochlorin cobaltochelatase